MKSLAQSQNKNWKKEGPVAVSLIKILKILQRYNLLLQRNLKLWFFKLPKNPRLFRKNSPKRKLLKFLTTNKIKVQLDGNPFTTTPNFKIRKENCLCKNMNQLEWPKKKKKIQNALFNQMLKPLRNTLPQQVSAPRVFHHWIFFIMNYLWWVSNQTVIAKCMTKIRSGRNKKLRILRSWSNKKKRKKTVRARSLHRFSLCKLIGMIKTLSIYQIQVLNQFKNLLKSKKSRKWRVKKRILSGPWSQAQVKFGLESQPEEKLPNACLDMTRVNPFINLNSCLKVLQEPEVLEVLRGNARNQHTSS